MTLTIVVYFALALSFANWVAFLWLTVRHDPPMLKTLMSPAAKPRTPRARPAGQAKAVAIEVGKASGVAPAPWPWLSKRRARRPRRRPCRWRACWWRRSALPACGKIP